MRPAIEEIENALRDEAAAYGHDDADGCGTARRVNQMQVLFGARS
jgi:hypothetical protein